MNRTGNAPPRKRVVVESNNGPCIRCGSTERYLRANGGRDCGPCRRKSARKYAQKMRVIAPDRQKANSLKWRQSNPDKWLSSSLRTRWGIDLAAYERKMVEQRGTCAICKKPCKSGKRLAVDHDHSTNQLRGLLCTNCNTAIGSLSDSSDLCRKAAEYLEGWKNG